MLARFLWTTGVFALVVLAAADEYREFGWEGIGPPLAGCRIALPFLLWRLRRRG